MMPVRLSVTEVHWRIIANLGFKLRSHFTAHWPPCCCGRHAAGESSRAMLASARVSCLSFMLHLGLYLGSLAFLCYNINKLLTYLLTTAGLQPVRTLVRKSVSN